MPSITRRELDALSRDDLLRIAAWMIPIVALVLAAVAAVLETLFVRGE